MQSESEVDVAAFHLHQLGVGKFQLRVDICQQFVHVSELLLVINHQRVAPQTLAKSQEFRGMPLSNKDRDVANEVKKW
jgi:hypothetical protein